MVRSVTGSGNKTSSVKSPVKLSAAKLRRIALKQQGLLNARSLGTGQAGVAQAISHLGYVQIDTISVVERAHHHVLWSRVKNYKPAYLDAVVANKQIFEYWFHAAAYLPMHDFRFALPRMHAIKAGEKHWFDNIDEKLLRRVYKRIEQEGPLRARDFIDTKSTNTGWWDWKPAKRAIEKLFMQGDLMIVGREGFQKRYDLTERVLPDGINTKIPDAAEEAKHLIDTTLRAHGFANLKSVTYLRKGKELRAAVRETIEHYLETGEVVEVQSPEGHHFYMDAALLSSTSNPARQLRLLSPFDNLVIQRARGREIFDFDYQIECYVPAAKRQHGYFCLPVLYKDNLVGRVDCKAGRKTQVLKLLYLQHSAVDGDFMQRLAAELERFMQFNGCTRVEITRLKKNDPRRALIGLLSA